jgi:hypothetical protein
MKGLDKAVLILFKSALIDSRNGDASKEAVKLVSQTTIPKGFMISPSTIATYTSQEIDSLIKVVEKELIISRSQMNNAFHKSWDKIANASDLQLYIEQIVHYMTTYGPWSSEEHTEDNIFIPYEKLEIPELTENIPLLYIKSITKDELKEKVLGMLSSGVALKKETIELLSPMLDLFDFTEGSISELKNKEVKIILYNKKNIVPGDPLEFLRYLIFETTGKTLIIKNSETIELIKTNLDQLPALRNRIESLFKNYDTSHGLKLLSQIFYRSKLIFLAFKATDYLSSVINKLRKLAIKTHHPMKEDYLNSITKHVKNNHPIDIPTLKEELSKVNIFRKIRLMYALHYRTLDCESIAYRIRNGKAYSKALEIKDKDGFKETLEVVEKSVIEDLKKSVEDKNIFIPSMIDYALPSSEKQFTGNFPSGTRVHVPEHMVVGIHWENQKGKQIDLDLSLIDISGVKYGWDGSYRNKDRSVLFSGDMTSAPLPNGASELFYVKNLEKGVYMLSVNYYNYDANIPVPFKIFVGFDNEFKNMSKSYMLDPNNVLASTSTVANRKQKILGSLFISEDGCEFVFSEMYMGKSISLNTENEYVRHTQSYLYNFYRNSISMKELLDKAGANMIEDTEGVEEYIDLSPEALQRDTILSLITNKK